MSKRSPHPVGTSGRKQRPFIDEREANGWLLPLSRNPEFVALPSDPAIPLTPEQEAALWGGDVDGVLRTIRRGAYNDFMSGKWEPENIDPETLREMRRLRAIILGTSFEAESAHQPQTTPTLEICDYAEEIG